MRGGGRMLSAVLTLGATALLLGAHGPAGALEPVQVTIPTLPPVIVPDLPAVTVGVDAPVKLPTPVVPSAPEATVEAVPAAAPPAPTAAPAPVAPAEAPGVNAPPALPPGFVPPAAGPPPVSLTSAVGTASRSFAVPLAVLAALAAYAVAGMVRDRRDRTLLETSALDRWVRFR